ncbi:CBR1 [Symbiodinium sp. CCMP2592]|nr:CBR1 [Symbiodinium sp. CCMP2592]
MEMPKRNCRRRPALAACVVLGLNALFPLGDAISIFGNAGFFQQGLFEAFSSQRKIKRCIMLRKETLCQSVARGEPVRRFVFQAPEMVNISTGLRQVVVVLGPGPGALPIPRMYSPTSEPRSDGTFDLVVRVYRQGQVSRWLDSLKPGDSVSMMWPHPSPLPADRRNPGRRVGLIAFGIGITELYRTAVQELADPNVKEVVLLYATRTMEEQQVLQPEIQALAKKESRFRLDRILSQESHPDCRHGRVDSSVLEEVFPWSQDANLRAEARFVSAGSQEMMKHAHDLLAALGYDPRSYKLIRDASLSSVFQLFAR